MNSPFAIKANAAHFLVVPRILLGIRQSCLYTQGGLGLDSAELGKPEDWRHRPGGDGVCTIRSGLGTATADTVAGFCRRVSSGLEPVLPRMSRSGYQDGGSRPGDTAWNRPVGPRRDMGSGRQQASGSTNAAGWTAEAG